MRYIHTIVYIITIVKKTALNHGYLTRILYAWRTPKMFK